MIFSRLMNNPLITSASVRPSRLDFEVIGTFNAGVTQINGEIVLLVRVAERPVQRESDAVYCPYLTGNGEIAVKVVSKADSNFVTSDPRVVKDARTGETFLTSISHLRLAHSGDGVVFRVEDRPWIAVEAPYETFGMEDARITQIGDTFYVNYSAVSPHGIATGLLSTRDFVTVQRHGVIFPPSNRDVVLFPRQIDGLYVCYHRPMPGDLGKYSIWMATSPDLIHWGGHRVVLEGTQQGWDSGRVGGGAPPIWTEQGWLSIYHAADRGNRYCLGAFLTPHDAPGTVLHRSPTPILAPEADYETRGFFPNVVFTCGAVLLGDTLRIYYGASDDTIAAADVSLDELLDRLITG